MFDQFLNDYVSRPRALAFIRLAVPNQMNGGTDSSSRDGCWQAAIVEVVILVKDESPAQKGRLIFLPEQARNLYPVECLEPCEPTKSLPTNRQPVRRKSSIEGIEIIIVKTNTIVSDDKPNHGRIIIIEEGLLPLDLDSDAPSNFRINVVDRLGRIDHRLEQGQERLPFRKARLTNLVLKVDFDRHDGL